MSTLEIQIRNLKVDDVYPLEELLADPEMNPFQDRPPFTKWDHNQFLASMNNNKASVLVARCGSKIAGYVAYRRPTSTLIVIDMIVVDVFYRRKRIGQKLISDVLYEAEASEQVRKVKVTASDKLTGFHLFLRDAGFKAVRVDGDNYVFEQMMPIACEV